MIKLYNNGNELLQENEAYLNTNRQLSGFFFWDAPLLEKSDKINYALKVYDGQNELLALKIEPYDLLLFGAPSLAGELVTFLISNGYEIKNMLGSEELLDTICDELKQYGYEYYEALAMSFMRVTEKTEPSCDEVETAQAADIDELAVLMERFNHDCGLLDKVNIDQIRKDIDRFRVLRRDGMIVCMAKCAGMGDDTRISDVYTRDEYRNKGLARIVVNTLKNEMIDELGFSALNVDKKNPISNKLYYSLGFRPVFSQGEYRRK